MHQLKRSIKRFLIGIELLSSLLLIFSVYAPTVQAQIIDPSTKQSACEGVGAGAGCVGGAQQRINTTLQDAITVFSIVIGIISTIMVMIGGFKLITSSGDPQRVSSAKTTITYALIGLVVVAMSQVLVHFVLARIH